MMKTVRLVEPGRPLEHQAVPVPEIGPRDALVRVKAAGICHSDAHYRAGTSRVDPLPLTLGHEVAGVVERTGAAVSALQAGHRVCLHYLATCGDCAWCRRGHEQFCISGAMIGKHRDGGFAEFIVVPARSVVRLPDELPFEQGAILMCSSATALHALRKARLAPGETVAVFGAGGLGSSAIQLARAFGALRVFAVDIQPGKLKLAEQLGAVPINAADQDPVGQILRRTDGRGVDVALELIGLPVTMRQAVGSLAIFGRAALAGITDQSFEIAPYHQMLNKEAEIIGVSDHLAQELPLLLDWARQGKLGLQPSGELCPLRLPAEHHEHCADVSLRAGQQIIILEAVAVVDGQLDDRWFPLPDATVPASVVASSAGDRDAPLEESPGPFFRLPKSFLLMP